MFDVNEQVKKMLGIDIKAMYDKNVAEAKRKGLPWPPAWTDEDAAELEQNSSTVQDTFCEWLEGRILSPHSIRRTFAQELYIPENCSREEAIDYFLGAYRAGRIDHVQENLRRCIVEKYGREVNI